MTINRTKKNHCILFLVRLVYRISNTSEYTMETENIKINRETTTTVICSKPVHVLRHTFLYCGFANKSAAKKKKKMNKNWTLCSGGRPGW